MWWFKRQNGSREPALARLGSLETELMERIWFRGDVSVRDLHAEFSPQLAYTTIMTTLDRLYKKGLLRRTRAGKAYIYTPEITEKKHRERVAEHLISMALQDGRNSNAVLSCFVDFVSEADQQMLSRLDQLVRAKRRALRRLEPR
jgi:predicted transcriptional regulator